MDTTNLYQSLTFLAYSTGIIIILVGIMLIKVLFNISKLADNINKTTEIIKTELTPTLKNINKSVEIISNVVIKTDEGISKIKDLIKSSPLNIISKAASITGTVTKGFFGGLCTAFKMFSKKK